MDKKKEELKKIKLIFNSAEIDFIEKFIVIISKNKTENFPYKINQEDTEIIINGKVYKIPHWYNKEMIKIRDLKTLQMILYGKIQALEV